MPNLPTQRTASMPGSGQPSQRTGYLQAQPGSGIGQRYSNTNKALGGFSGGASGGGGGGTARDMISRIRGEVMGKVSGMGPGGTSTSSAISSSAGSYQFPSSEEAKPRMRGLARGFDPDQAGAVFGRPTLILDTAVKDLAPPSSPFHDMLSSLPATSLAMLTTSNKKATEKNRTSQQINAIGDVYSDAAKGTLPSFDELTKMLATARPKSALGQAMVPPRPERTITGYRPSGKPQYSREEPDYFTSPLTTATDTLSSMIGAIGQASNLDERVVSAQMAAGDYLIDQEGAKQLKKAPSKMKPINKKVSKKLY
jgi:hypothetical protein